MIRSLNAGPFLQVQHGSASAPYINNNGQPMTGMVRYNNNHFEVYDGIAWLQVGEAYPIINLHQDAINVIEWGMKKMREELEIKKIAQEHPAVKAAYDNFQRASDQLKTTIILSHNEETTS